MRGTILWSLVVGLTLREGSILRAETYLVDPRHPGASDDAGVPGSAERPWITISRAAEAVEPGDVVRIRGGVYRERVKVERSGTQENPIRFEAAPAARVVVTGADRVTGWKRAVPPGSGWREGARPGEESGSGGPFVADWPHSFINHRASHTHPADDYHAVIGRAEQVFVQGYPLWQVPSLEKLSRGTFFVDLEARKLYAWSRENLDLSRRDILVEASARSTIWECRGDHIELRGLRFRYAANAAQHGACRFAGRGNVIEDCTFERTNSCGAEFRGEDHVVRRCAFTENGQLGFAANRAHRLLLTGCLVSDNNRKGFQRGWEAGGNKLVLSRDVILEKSRFLGNRGDGIWFDIGNEDCTVRNCLIADNEDAGLYYEISFGLHAHDNVIIGNGFAGTPGAWGSSAGVSISSSPGCTIERNLIIGNKEGFNFREQSRRTPRIDEREAVSVWNHDELIRQNVLAWNRDAQTWGWFDVDDARHWPRAQQKSPAALSLEELRLKLERNLYAAGPHEGLFHWGVPWKRCVRYSSLEKVRRELDFEAGSRIEAFVFGSFASRDFRVPPDSAALEMGCYPRGEVPGVQLGVLKD